MSLEANARIASELHAAINSRELDKAMELFADDASWIVMPGGTCYTKEDIRRYFEKIMKFYERFILRDIHPPVVSGSMLTHEYTIDAKLRDGPEGFIPAVVVIELSDGKISQVRSYIDKLEAAKQMAKGFLAKWIVASVENRVAAIANP